MIREEYLVIFPAKVGQWQAAIRVMATDVESAFKTAMTNDIRHHQTGNEQGTIILKLPGISVTVKRTPTYTFEPTPLSHHEA